MWVITIVVIGLIFGSLYLLSHYDQNNSVGNIVGNSVESENHPLLGDEEYEIV